MRNEIVNRKHLYWWALTQRLCEGLQATCCEGTTAVTERVLWSLPNIDVQATLSVFSNEGCECDCMVLMLLRGLDDSCF